MAKLLPPAIYHVMGLILAGDMGPFTFYTNKNKKHVFYPKAPPEKPPTIFKLRHYQRWKNAAWQWSNMPQTTRDDWNLAAARAHTRISGYNLWIYWITTHDRPALETVERQSNTTLLSA